MYQIFRSVFSLSHRRSDIQALTWKLSSWLRTCTSTCRATLYEVIKEVLVLLPPEPFKSKLISVSTAAHCSHCWNFITLTSSCLCPWKTGEKWIRKEWDAKNIPQLYLLVKKKKKSLLKLSWPLLSWEKPYCSLNEPLSILECKLSHCNYLVISLQLINFAHLWFFGFLNTNYVSMPYLSC